MDLDSRLSRIYREIAEIVVSRQHPVTGLFPASTAVTTHGNYQDAWVRDNVYSVICVWAVSLACERRGREQERDSMAQVTIKLMRGLLQSMMRQSAKVESFKLTQNRLDALHAKYDTATGLTIVTDDGWGHLQLDATSLFLLMLAQMTRSGLRIVCTMDEVQFVQNLVYYIATAYRTPDYGIWERGNKINDGNTEINASSLGMVKSALRAMDGFNCFGADGPASACIHVVSDAIAHARGVLYSLLPRESLSKEVDSAGLSITGFPAFAVGEPELVELTEGKIREKLAGQYGYKRFLLDGHQTAVEDLSRIHYEQSELVNFEHIESEWPLFLCFEYLNALFAGNRKAASDFRFKIDAVTVEVDGRKLLPELYSVPADAIEAEKSEPGTQRRVANQNLPLIWAQSLFYTGQLLEYGLLTPDDLELSGLREKRSQTNDTQIALVVLAENDIVRGRLEAASVLCETVESVAPVAVIAANRLSDIYSRVGACEPLGLTGRPDRSLQSLMTSQTFVISDTATLCLSWLQSFDQDYRMADGRLLALMLDWEIDYTLQHWFYDEVAVITILATESMLECQHSSDLLQRLRQYQQRSQNPAVGYASAALAIRASRRHMIVTQQPHRAASPIEISAATARNATGGGSLLTALARLSVLESSSTVDTEASLLTTLQSTSFESWSALVNGWTRNEIKAIYQAAVRAGHWLTARFLFGELGYVHRDTNEAIVWLCSRRITLVVGRRAEDGQDSALVVLRDLQSVQLESDFIFPLSMRPIERALTAELIVTLGAIARIQPDLLEGLRTIEVSLLMDQLLDCDDSGERVDEPGVSTQLLALSPYSLVTRLVELVTGERARYQDALDSSFSFLGFSNGSSKNGSVLDNLQGATNSSWLQWRHSQGLLTRLESPFLEALWHCLDRMPAIVFSDAAAADCVLNCEKVRASTTAGEESFAQYIDRLLGRVHPAYYRTAITEALGAVAQFCAASETAHFADAIHLPALLDAAATRYVAASPRIADASSRNLDIMLQAAPTEVNDYLIVSLAARSAQEES